MEVTKCDRCGCYVDKPAVNMPILIYSYSQENAYDRVRKSLCYECYAKLKIWLNDEEKNDE